jgi:hypothetical protein
MAAEIRRPTAFAQVSGIGSSLHVEGISINTGINTWPRCAVSAHKDSGALVQDVTSDQATSYIGALQSRMFEARTAPDCTLSTTDGKGGSLTFRGFSVGPSYTVTSGQVSPDIEFLGEAAIISGVRPSIYIHGGTEDGGGKPGEFDSELPGIATGMYPSQRTISVLNYLMDRWRTNPNRSLREFDAAVANIVDKVQQPAINAFFKLLSSSTDELEAWEALSEDTTAAQAINGNINQLIAQILKYPTSDFMANIQRLCSEFELIYVPSLRSGNMGKLIKAEDVLDGEATGKTVKIASMQISLTNRGTLPLQQIVVRGLASPMYEHQGYADKKKSNNAKIATVSVALAAYPEEPYEGGRIADISMPLYIAQHIPVIDGKTLELLELKPNMDVSVYTDEKVVLQDMVKTEGNSIVKPVIDRHARNAYIDAVLTASTVSLSTDLDYSWEVGKRYHVSCEKSGSLFSGFLAGLSHSLSVGAGSARSTLNFSHVETDGWSLSR